MGTAVRSKIAISAPGGDDLVQQVLDHSLGALAIQRTDERKREDWVTSKHFAVSDPASHRSET